jgi:hypothetical protein
MTSPTPSDGPSQPAVPHRRLTTVVIWLAVLGLTCGLLLPNVQRIRDGEAYAMSAYNLRQIGDAIRIYHEAYGNRLPAAARKGKDGQPLLSWRVMILPYLDEDSLYRRFHLDEPWDGPHNLPLLEKMPRAYTKPWKSDTRTHYQAFVGPGTAFERDGLSLADFPDGLANTVLVVESAEAVPWTKPGDLAYAPDQLLPQLGLGFTKPVKLLSYELRRKPGFNAVFADGTVRFLDADTDEATRRAIITRNGGEPVNASKWD